MSQPPGVCVSWAASGPIHALQELSGAPLAAAALLDLPCLLQHTQNPCQEDTGCRSLRPFLLNFIGPAAHDSGLPIALTLMTYACMAGTSSLNQFCDDIWLRVQHSTMTLHRHMQDPKTAGSTGTVVPQCSGHQGCNPGVHCALTEHPRQVQAGQLTTPKVLVFWAGRACLAIFRRPCSATARSSPATSSLLLASSTGSPADHARCHMMLQSEAVQSESTRQGRTHQHTFLLSLQVLGTRASYPPLELLS